MEKDSRNVRAIKFGLVVATTFAFLPLKFNTSFMEGQMGLFFLFFIFLPAPIIYLWIKGTKKVRSLYTLFWLGPFLVIFLLLGLMLFSISGL